MSQFNSYPQTQFQSPNFQPYFENQLHNPLPPIGYSAFDYQNSMVNQIPYHPTSYPEHSYVEVQLCTENSLKELDLEVHEESCMSFDETFARRRERIDQLLREISKNLKILIHNHHAKRAMEEGDSLHADKVLNKMSSREKLVNEEEIHVSNVCEKIPNTDKPIEEEKISACSVFDEMTSRDKLEERVQSDDKYRLFERTPMYKSNEELGSKTILGTKGSTKFALPEFASKHRDLEHPIHEFVSFTAFADPSHILTNSLKNKDASQLFEKRLEQIQSFPANTCHVGRLLLFAPTRETILSSMQPFPLSSLQPASLVVPATSCSNSLLPWPPPTLHPSMYPTDPSQQYPSCNIHTLVSYFQLKHNQNRLFEELNSLYQHQMDFGFLLHVSIPVGRRELHLFSLLLGD